MFTAGPCCCGTAAVTAAAALSTRIEQAQAQAAAQGRRPNIVIIWGDDIGQTDISAYSHGLMGFRTPNIDRIAREGMMFTDYYGEQSCTAGRAAFLTGQSVFRTGNSKVGLPGAPQGLQKEDPTIAEMLKPLGYATGQFGKNHLGDRNEYLPTVHGFDEFYGNLYHLNAEEEPELPDYPDPQKYPEFPQPLRAARRDAQLRHRHRRPDRRPALRARRQQKIEDTGPLTKKRMETIDDDIADRAAGFIEQQAQGRTSRSSAGSTSPTCISAPTRSRTASGQAGRWQSPYHDVMIDHDKNVGTVLRKARRARHRRRHHRVLQHRQRPAHELAGRTPR